MQAIFAALYKGERLIARDARWMLEPLMPDAVIVPSDRIAPALFAVAALGAVLSAIAATLWAYYGTTVFFEMLAAGLAYCF